MCNYFPKKQVKATGLILSIAYGLLTIICLFVQGYDFNVLNMSWTTLGPWRFTAILQLSSSLIAFVFCIMSIVVFAAGECKTIQLIVRTLSTLFAFSISVFTLTAGAIGTDKSTLDCQKDYTGVFQYFGALDNYFHHVDQILCSKECPCYFSNQTTLEEFLDDPEYGIQFEEDGLTYFNQRKVMSFSNCDRNEQFSSLNSNSVVLYSYSFDSYWTRIEEKFNCTGWCDLTYRKPEDTKDTKMTKYLFSDINRGVVRNRGCMKPMIDWLPKMLNAFGYVMLIVSIFQGASVGFTLSLYFDKVLEGSNYPDMNTFNNKANANNNTNIVQEGKKDDKDDTNIEGIIGGNIVTLDTLGKGNIKDK